MFPNMRIRHKLLLSYSLLFFLALLVAFATVYTILRNAITTNIESELQNTTTAIYNLVKASAAVSTKNYLRAVAEKNHEIVRASYDEFLRGEISEQEAKNRASRLLLSQSIGQSGYIYCLDSNGIVTVHPQSQLLQSDVSEYTFVRDQMLKKKGYLEYDWQNPGETKSRPKGLYMVHFEPWDWIISVSAYRSEFKDLVNVDDFKKSVLDLRFGKTGYSFVITGNGTVIIHPKLEGVNLLTSGEFPKDFLSEMLDRKSGRIIYPWKNPGEEDLRKKLCLFNYIEDYDWIVGSASYLDEFYEPLHTTGLVLLTIFILTLLFVLLLTAKLSGSITDPLQRLMQFFEQASTGNFRLRMAVAGRDEIGTLSNYFNKFMAQLEAYSSSLKQEIEVRRAVENSLRESEERYRSIMEAAADPIVIYDMQGCVVYFNPAFHKIFGWTLTESIGRKMDHFVPEENWPETAIMIAAIQAGGMLPITETKRTAKDGKVITVSVSGAAYRDNNNNLVGSVIILRDITETKRLSKLLMDIGDNVRQTIGQDMHDDLCPHLIGIAGLTAVLKHRIEKSGMADTELADRIIALIGEATAKARGLARGLCPVHLVSHGLHAALRDLAANSSLASNISCTFSGDESLVITDNALATHMYYIAQEAVNNAIRHADASVIEISLTEEGDYLYLRIADDGCGIKRDGHGNGIGLEIMKYRVLVIGAYIAIDTAPGQGTTIHVSMKSSITAQQSTTPGSPHGPTGEA
jgi:PAS domain S-box-containing protein